MYHTHAALTDAVIAVIKSAGCSARIHERPLDDSGKRIEIAAEGVGRASCT